MRGVAVIDTTGEFLHAVMDKHIIMALKVKLVEMTAMVDTKLYRKHIMTDHKDQSMMCIKMNLLSAPHHTRLGVRMYKRLGMIASIV